MKRVAIIPARGGSKRVPRKNVLPFRGKPMVAHTIEAAVAADVFEKIVVSTEDEEIAAAAHKWGADVATRPRSLAGDEARVVDVCLEFLDNEENKGFRYDVLCCLFATAPLRGPEDIRNVVALASPGECDFAFGVTDYDLPPHQAVRQEDDGTLAPMWPELINKRASEVGRLLVDNGSTYAVSVPAFRRERSFFGPGMRGHIMPRERSVDLDEEIDLEILGVFAEKLGL